MTESAFAPRNDLEFLGTQDLMKLLQVSRLSVYRLIERGLLPVYRVCRLLRFKKSDVAAFLESRRAEARRTDLYGRPQD